MIKTITARRIIVIVDASLKDQLLERFLELGAKGYNYVSCSGKGNHMGTGDPFSSDGLVRIEVIASAEIAEAILDYIHAVQFHQFGRYALTAFSSSVEIDERDQSLI